MTEHGSETDAAERDWTDRIVGDRMAVDRAFADRVSGSQFSRQEWGLIMTAVEFDVADADDPERARLVGDTSRLPQVLPELENVRGGLGGPGAPGERAGGREGGVVDTLKGALGLGGGEGSGGGVDPDEQEAAERLVAEYTDLLQERLEREGKWEDVCAAAGEEGD